MAAKISKLTMSVMISFRLLVLEGCSVEAEEVTESVLVTEEEAGGDNPVD